METVHIISSVILDLNFLIYFILLQGVMWSAGNYPPSFTVDHVQAWQYYSFAAQRGQIDSKILVALYNARGGHPSIIRNSWIAARQVEIFNRYIK